jgi:DNA-binding IclR family transcriptional regulator
MATQHDQHPEDRQYRAPALEKGLDVLELLAHEDHPLTLSQIVQRLGRSTGEMFRMVQVLEQRGFVAQGRDGFSLTARLFQLGLQRPPTRGLIEIALPRMRELSSLVGQACHIAFHSVGEMVVVARMESPGHLGHSVRVGYRRPLHLATSGIVLYAFQPADVREQWENLIQPRPTSRELTRFRRDADEIRDQGYAMRLSGFVDGITDLTVPILRSDRAAAALAVPFMHLKTPLVTEKAVISEMLKAAREMSAEIIAADTRV